MTDNRVYGYVNGKEVYSRDEFIFTKRGFGAIDTDEQLIAYAEKVSHGWYSAGHRRTFESFYLSDYALNEPYTSLTSKEFSRLKELQKLAIAKKKQEEETRNWQYVKTIYWADNSTEDIWEDKDGNRQTVMVEAPHGDACY